MTLIYITLGLISSIGLSYLFIKSFAAPEGYEDETGFHLKPEPVTVKKAYPAVDVCHPGLAAH